MDTFTALLLGIIIIILIIAYLFVRSIASAFVILVVAICIIIVLRSIIVNVLVAIDGSPICLVNIIIDLVRAFFSYRLFFTVAKDCAEPLGGWKMFDSALGFVVVFIFGGTGFLVSEAASLMASAEDTGKTIGDAVLKNLLYSFLFCCLAAYLMYLGEIPLFE